MRKLAKVLLAGVAALSLTFLCAVTMLLVRKETTDVKDE